MKKSANLNTTAVTDSVSGRFNVIANRFQGKLGHACVFCAKYFPRWLGWFLVFLFFLDISWHRLDPDFGWHLASGQYILAHGIPATDVFTYTASHFAWINVEWLNDVLVAKLYAFGGYGLLAVVASLLWTLPLLLVDRMFRRKKGLISKPIIVAAALLFTPYLGARTEVWAVLFIAIVYVVLLSRNRKLSWALPLIFWLWSQLHGSWPAGLALAGWWAVFRETEVRAKRRLWLLILASFLLTLVNPYGARELFVIAQTGFDPALKTSINEWMPIWRTVPGSIVIYLVLVATASLAFFIGPRSALNQDKSINQIALTAKTSGLFNRFGFLRKISREKLDFLREPMWPFLLAAISATRYWPLFVIVSLGPASQKFRQMLTGIPHLATKSAKIVLTGVAVLVATLFIFSFSRSGLSLAPPLNPEKIPLTTAIDYLREHPCHNNLFNAYDFGGYLTWKLPTQKIFIDGRMPSWTINGALFGPTYMQIYNKTIHNAAYGRQVFAKYNIGCALVSPDVYSDMLTLHSSNWRTVLRGNGFLLLER